MDNLANLSSHEISLLKDEKLKEKIKLDESHKDIKQAILRIMYASDRLKMRKRTFEQALTQNEFLIKKLNAELKILDGAFWTAKNSGL